MSISDQINRIKTNIANAYTSLESKGATIPADKNSNNLATTVDSISSSAFPNKAFDVDSAGVATTLKGHFKSSDFSSLTKISDYAMYFKWISVDASEYTDNVINFGNVTEIGKNGLNRAFSASKVGTTSNPCIVNFDNLTTVGENGLNAAFSRVVETDFINTVYKLSDNSFKKLTTIGAKGFYGIFRENSVLNTDISFPSLTTVYDYALGGAYFNNAITIQFPALETINASNVFTSFHANSVKDVSFTKLTTVSGSSIFNYAFSSHKYLNNVQFPKLEQISGYNAFGYAFSSCSALTTMSFPSLTSITGSSVFNYAFQYCRSLTTMSFPSLTSVDGSSIFVRSFSDCSALATISFPSLTTITNKNSFNYCFAGCTALTEIHFRADAQSTIEGLDGYSTKFGATNATIYFDL